jgi:hypothetical protein
LATSATENLKTIPIKEKSRKHGSKIKEREPISATKSDIDLSSSVLTVGRARGNTSGSAPGLILRNSSPNAAKQSLTSSTSSTDGASNKKRSRALKGLSFLTRKSERVETAAATNTTTRQRVSLSHTDGEKLRSGGSIRARPLVSTDSDERDAKVDLQCTKVLLVLFAC